MPTTSQLMGVGMPPELAKLLGGTAHAVQSEVDMRTALLAGQPIVISSPITLTSNLAITTQVIFLQGGRIITNGYTCTITGALSAGAYQIFTTSGAEVVFGPNSTLYILMEWFGALGDGTTDDTSAIQLACDCSVVPRVPVKVLYKTYRVSTINLPSRLVMQGDQGRAYGGTFKSNSTGAVFKCATAYGETNIVLEGGFILDGNNTASSCIDVAGATGLNMDRINIKNATVGILMTGNSGGLALFNRCRFTDTLATAVQISAGVLDVTFQFCMFASTSTTGIYTDASWTGDHLRVYNCTFDLGVCDYHVRCEHVSGNDSNHLIHKGNRHDGSCFVANICVGRYVYADIQDNGISGSTSPIAITIDGYECYLANNFLNDKGISFGVNSKYCRAGPQRWGFSPNQYVDSGDRNFILESKGGVRAKGTTAERPVLLATAQFGYTYLDTTLDADGKPIWWNGAAWVDATGAVV